MAIGCTTRRIPLWPYSCDRLDCTDTDDMANIGRPECRCFGYDNNRNQMSMLVNVINLIYTYTYRKICVCVGLGGGWCGCGWVPARISIQ